MGVSGGRDSIVLLHALLKSGYRHLTVCHLNHQLRGKASNGDADFVRQLAVKNGLAFLSAEADVKKFAQENHLSIETAARNLRYAFFAECARRAQCQELVLAHHADDQIETVLFNFLRGSGAAGLTGMKPQSRRGRLTIYRPLLAVTSDDICAYATEHGLKWRDDASNRSTAHTRNRIRHEILPVLDRSVGRNYRQAILRAAEILSGEEEWMDSLVPSPGDRLSCRELSVWPRALQRRFVRQWLIKKQIVDPGFEEVERVLSLLDAANGPAKINLPGDRHARRRAGEIFVE